MNVNDHTPFLFLHLLPPGTEGDQYNKMATDVHGVPIGEVNAKTLLAQQLGYSDKDTIGSSLDEVNDLAGQLNAALTNPKYASGDSFIIYLREVDPQHPTLPPIQELFHLLKEMLKEGKIGGTQVTHTTVEENTTKTDTKDTTKTDSTDTTETQVNTGGPPPKKDVIRQYTNYWQRPLGKWGRT